MFGFSVSPGNASAAVGGYGGGGFGGAGGLAQIAQVASIVGGPGGTAPFVGPINPASGGGGRGGAWASAGGTGARPGGGSGGGLFSPGGMTGMVKNLKSTWFNSGSIQTGSGTATTAAGIGGWKGDAAGVLTSQGAATAELTGGSMLAMAGLAGNQRGTWGGIGMGTAGGALMGAGIGTMIMPGIGTAIGAGVGAAVGFGVGVGEKLAGVESQVNEAKRLVKQIYGVGIDNALAKQIVEIARQKYANHVSIAVRDPDVRKTIELYAAASGQKMPLSATTPHGASLVEQGGSLYQAPTYMFGNPNVYQSNLPTAGGQSAGQYPSPMSLQVNVSGQGAAQFVAGQVVTPEFVQSQWSSAAASSNGRVANSAWMSQPGLVIA
jgi:hypothetical protein